jgi:hypothetical protein
VETKVFSAYNEGSKRVISPRLTVVDAAREPLKVLKILMEGLAADARSGIWLINFQGVPVARSHSAFDLIYLDDELRVVHAIEISERSEFMPFKGDPTSALVLAPTSLARSKTFTGDRVTIAAAEQRTVDPGSLPTSKRAPLPGRIVAAFSAKTFNVPTENIQASQPSAAVSGRLMRSGSLALDQSPLLRPATPPAIAQTPEVNRESRENKVVPISGARTPVPDVERAVAAEPPKRPDVTPATVPAAPPPASALFEKERQAAPKPQEFALSAPAAPPATETTRHTEPPLVAQTAGELVPTPQTATSIEEVTAPEPERTLVAHSFPSTNTIAYAAEDLSPPPEVLIDSDSITSPALPSPASSSDDDAWISDVRSSSAQIEQGRKALASLKRRWDVRLLYMLFPELDPSYRPEFQAPVVDFRKDVFQTGSPKLSRKIQILSWFYPDLQLDTVHQRQREHRRAPRIPQPGLVGYYFTGGKAEPHEIRHLSVMGFYMVTEERWLPGTVIRVTLQMRGEAEDPADSVTVLSRSVNWDEQGGGFEFVLPGFID